MAVPFDSNIFNAFVFYRGRRRLGMAAIVVRRRQRGRPIMSQDRAAKKDCANHTSMSRGTLEAALVARDEN